MIRRYDLVYKHDTTKEPICRICGTPITLADGWAVDKDRWFYCDQCCKNIEAKEHDSFFQDRGITIEHDPVNHPSHYTSHPSGVECIQITEHMNFCLGNAIKYIWRAGLKDTSDIEDLEKAVWYINREIQRRKNA